MRPKLLLLDEPTEGIQPSIIKDIGRAISYLRGLGNMAIVLVEQYLDFACELGDNFAVMDRGAVKYACDRVEPRSRRNQPPDGAVTFPVRVKIHVRDKAPERVLVCLGNECGPRPRTRRQRHFAANRAQGTVAFGVHLQDGVTRRGILHEFRLLARAISLARGRGTVGRVRQYGRRRCRRRPLRYRHRGGRGRAADADDGGGGKDLPRARTGRRSSTSR